MKPSTALWYEAQEKLALRTELLCPAAPGEITLEALWSGVSLGTERLVFRGQIPRSEWSRMRCPHQSGSFPFPVKYGYGFVGRIMGETGRKSGNRVFCLHPHQSHAVVAEEAVYDLPDAVPSRRAILAANMETAVTIVWDSGVSVGDRVLVVGAGVVGQLVAYLLSRMAGVSVVIADVAAERREIAEQLGLYACAPDSGPRDCDVAINASASEAGLQTAIDAVGLEGRVVEASWFGARTSTIALGGAFHSRRLQIVSSQVGHVPADRRARWTTRRRMETAIAFLADPVLDTLITDTIDFAAAPDALPLRFDDASSVAVALRYPAGEETE